MLLVVSNLTVGLISAFEGEWDRASFFAIMGVGLLLIEKMDER